MRYQSEGKRPKRLLPRHHDVKEVRLLVTVAVDIVLLVSLWEFVVYEYLTTASQRILTDKKVDESDQDMDEDTSSSGEMSDDEESDRMDDALNSSMTPSYVLRSDGDLMMEMNLPTPDAAKTIINNSFDNSDRPTSNTNFHFGAHSFIESPANNTLTPKFPGFNTEGGTTLQWDNELNTPSSSGFLNTPGSATSFIGDSPTMGPRSLRMGAMELPSPGLGLNSGNGNVFTFSGALNPRAFGGPGTSDIGQLAQSAGMLGSGWSPSVTPRNATLTGVQGLNNNIAPPGLPSMPPTPTITPSSSKATSKVKKELFKDVKAKKE